MNNDSKINTDKRKETMKKVLIIGGIAGLTAVAIGGGYYLFRHMQLSQNALTVRANLPCFKNVFMMHNCKGGKSAVIQNSFDKVISSASTSSPGPKTAIDAVTVSVGECADMPRTEYINKRINYGIRNLPKNQHASPEKLLQAQEKNIILGENQTFWNPFDRKYLVKVN